MSDCRHTEGCSIAEKRGINCCRDCPECGDCNSACRGQQGCCEECSFRAEAISNQGGVWMTMEDHLAEGERRAVATDTLRRIAVDCVRLSEAKLLALEALNQIEQPLPGAARWQTEQAAEDGRLFA